MIATCNPVCPVDNERRHDRFAISLLSPALVPAYTTAPNAPHLSAGRLSTVRQPNGARRGRMNSK
jgi:hypothetical protein